MSDEAKKLFGCYNACASADLERWVKYGCLIRHTIPELGFLIINHDRFPYSGGGFLTFPFYSYAAKVTL